MFHSFQLVLDHILIYIIRTTYFTKSVTKGMTEKLQYNAKSPVSSINRYK